LTEGSDGVCYVPKPGIGAQVKLYHSVHGCVHVAFGQIPGNLPIRFVTGIEPDRVVDLDATTDLVSVDHAFSPRWTHLCRF
jgi:hypothetical protein